jgi:tetratricopeptide (TPR) repeat protein
VNPVPTPAVPSDPAPGPAGNAALAEIVAALRHAGMDPSRDELADALWLARWCAPATGNTDGADPAAARPRGTPGDVTATGPADSRADDPAADDAAGQPGTAPARPAHRPGAERLTLHPAPRRSAERAMDPRAGAVPVAVPEAPALPGRLGLQRALRPLQRLPTAAAPTREVLDEPATAERSARAGGLLMPVFRRPDRGDASMQLLMDASSSMYVWERMLGEFRQVFEQLGAFREVRVQFLHEAPDGTVVVSGRFEASAAALRSSEQLLDPTGGRVTVLLSDCVGPLWRSGAAHRLLYRLHRHAPVAVLQPLPQRLWPRTRLPVSYGVLTRAEAPAHPPRLRFAEADPAAAVGGAPEPDRGPRRRARGAVAEIPVLPPSELALGAWARLLAGTGSGPVPAAVGRVRADQPPAPRPRSRPEPPPEQLVRRFRSSTSSGAGQLVVYLAAAPLFLPVMQLVQRTMLPDSGPAELSEVLLSGLLTRTAPEAFGDGRWYEFAPGVRDALLGPLARDEALLVLKHCSEYVEQRFGKGGPNFPALAIAQLESGDTGEYTGPAADTLSRLGALEGGTETAAPRIPQPFAEVAAKVLERFAPLPGGPDVADGVEPPGQSPSAAVHQAQALVERFEADGMVQNLLDAVQLLRRATARERSRGADPQLWCAFAQNLLRLWQLQGGAALLREAQDAATVAAAHPGAGRSRAVLARVLHAAASERRTVGDARGALDLLRRADREFTAGSSTPGLEPAEALGIALERARVLEDQWLLGGDAGLLEETVGMLEAFADAWPITEPQPSGLPLAHGRALLELAGTAADPERARVYARQAAVSLERGRAVLDGESPRPEERAQAVLDLVDAMLLSGERLDDAEALLNGILRKTPGQMLRSALLARAGRLRVRRYRDGGPATELEAAAARFSDACRSVPRDRPEYGDLIAEWGAVLLERAGLTDGERFVGQAVRVLRDCRMETPAGDRRLAERLLMLGRALILRYRSEEDLVDLREAEHVFDLAGTAADEPRIRATALLHLGEAHRIAFRHTHRPVRLDQAADAYRRAAEAARTAEAELPEPWEMVRLAASAHHWRGVVYEAARRPRAAREAYRAALAEWQRLPAGGGADEARTAARLTELTGV